MLENVHEVEQKTDVKVVLREIKYLIKDGQIQEGSGKFYHILRFIIALNGIKFNSQMSVVISVCFNVFTYPNECRLISLLTITQTLLYLYLDFAHKLQSLARKGNKEILAVFEASYEGNFFNQV